jgi:hypothetical protein
MLYDVVWHLPTQIGSIHFLGLRPLGRPFYKLFFSCPPPCQPIDQRHLALAIASDFTVVAVFSRRTFAFFNRDQTPCRTDTTCGEHWPQSLNSVLWIECPPLHMKVFTIMYLTCRGIYTLVSSKYVCAVNDFVPFSSGIISIGHRGDWSLAVARSNPVRV